MLWSGFSPDDQTLPVHVFLLTADGGFVVRRADPEVIHIVHFRGEADQILDATTRVGEVAVYGTFYREECGLSDLSPDELKLLAITDDKNAYATPLLALRALLERLDLLNSAIGLDKDGMSDAAFTEFQAMAPNLQLLPGSELLRTVRLVKTPFQVERLRKAGRCLEVAIFKAAANLYEGITETEIARNFELALVEAGARPSLTMLIIGRHAVGGQRRQWEDIVLQRGDLVWFDCDAICDGYWADIARVFVFTENQVPSTGNSRHYWMDKHLQSNM